MRAWIIGFTLIWYSELSQASPSPDQVIKNAVIENDTITLGCAFSDQSQWAKCEWTFNGDQVLKVVRDEQDGNSLRQVLPNASEKLQLSASLQSCDVQLFGVNSADSGHWQCKLKTATFRKVRIVHKLDVLWPTEVSIEAPTEVNLNEEYSISCSFRGGDPQPWVQAEIVDETHGLSRHLKFSSTEIVSGDVSKKAYFKYLPRVGDANSTILCIAKQMLDSEADPVFVVQDQVQLGQVYFKPTFTSEPIRQQTSKEITVVIEVSANPLPTKIKAMILNSTGTAIGNDRDFLQSVEETGLHSLRITLTFWRRRLYKTKGHKFLLQVENQFGTASYHLDFSIKKAKTGSLKIFGLVMLSLLLTFLALVALVSYIRRNTKVNRQGYCSGTSGSTEVSVISTIGDTVIANDGSIPLLNDALVAQETTMIHSDYHDVHQSKSPGDDARSEHLYDQVVDHRRQGRSDSELKVMSKEGYDTLQFDPVPNHPVGDNYDPLDLNQRKISAVESHLSEPNGYLSIEQVQQRQNQSCNC